MRPDHREIGKVEVETEGEVEAPEDISISEIIWVIGNLWREKSDFWYSARRSRLTILLVLISSWEKERATAIFAMALFLWLYYSGVMFIFFNSKVISNVHKFSNPQSAIHNLKSLILYHASCIKHPPSSICSFLPSSAWQPSTKHTLQEGKYN